MHELSICLALLDQVHAIAIQHNSKSVCRISVINGPLSGVETVLLEQAYTIACQGTVADEAQLEIESETLRVRCTICGLESDVVANNLTCQHCGDWHTEIIQGDRLLLAQVELEPNEN
ncbi:MAG: hydrogenase maturation nickel metallochaperone HypA [Magnetococcales bacterium]|nr:hydrogenase maturation nickel metallochaperone HypA [Magnetococcales bacterium]